MSPPMVERVARAVREARNEGNATDESVAIAAIAAMREPTHTMVLAGSNVSMDISSGQVFHAWQAMIDEVLR